jgi:hypothetical protein
LKPSPVGISIGGEKPVENVTISGVTIQITEGKTTVKPRLLRRETTHRVVEVFG